MLICPECHGKGETIYYVETDRDENTVTVEQRTGICRTCNGSGEKPFTNADKIRSEILTDEGLAELLVVYLDDWGEYETPIGHIETREEAIRKTVEWLQQEAE